MRRRSTATAEAAGAPLGSGGSLVARALVARILGARDRDRSPGTRELLAFRAGDDPAHLDELARRAEQIVPLSRFGRPLLSVAVLAPRSPTPGSRAALERQLDARWRAARPLVLRGWAAGLVRREAPSIRELERLLAALRRRGVLARFLASRGLATEPVGELDDPERDLEKRRFRVAGDLWSKSATLTSPATNFSGRVRFSFGREGDDDASTDEARHREVARLARRALPFADGLARSRSRARDLARLADGPVLLTQHIAYWNAPRGGALLHHDSFDEPARTRQRGVCYVQLSGATIWLALSTADLAKHVRSLLGALARGAAPWIADEHLGGRRAAARLARRARDRAWLVRELASPGCGAFASLVNYSPEFLGLAFDAGHGALLEAGDAILLPNHGYARTCHHAVWCAGDAPGAALSMAIRRAELGA